MQNIWLVEKGHDCQALSNQVVKINVDKKQNIFYLNSNSNSNNFYLLRKIFKSLFHLKVLTNVEGKILNLMEKLFRSKASPKIVSLWQTATLQGHSFSNRNFVCDF